MPIEDADGFEELPATIKALFDSLNDHATNSEEYSQIVDQIVKLTKVRQTVADITLHMFEATTKENEALESFALKKRELDMKLSEINKPDRVSADTWALVGANLAGIFMIIGYERFNVIASKALGFIRQIR